MTAQRFYRIMILKGKRPVYERRTGSRLKVLYTLNHADNFDYDRIEIKSYYRMKDYNLKYPTNEGSYNSKAKAIHAFKAFDEVVDKIDPAV